MFKKIYYLLIALLLQCSIFSLSPVSQTHIRNLKKRFLEYEKTFTPNNSEEGENLKKAIDYMNSLLQDNVSPTWSEMLTVYEFITGDYKNPEYTAEIRQQRLNTLNNNLLCPEKDNYILDIISFINLNYDKPEFAIRRAAELYSYFVGNQVLRVEYKRDDFYVDLLEKQNKSQIQEKKQKKKIKFSLKGGLKALITSFLSIFTIMDDLDLSDISFTGYCDHILVDKGIPGFDKIISNGVLKPFDAHHRWAWFLMNFLLLNNQLAPVYFNDYFDIHDSTDAACIKMENAIVKYGFEANKSA